MKINCSKNVRKKRHFSWGARIAAVLSVLFAFIGCELLEEEVDPTAPNYVNLVGSVGDTIVTVEFNRPDEDSTFASNVLIIDAQLSQIEESPTGSYSVGDESFDIELDNQILRLSDDDTADGTYDIEISGTAAADGTILGEVVFTDTTNSDNTFVGAIGGGDTTSEDATTTYSGTATAAGTYTYDYELTDPDTGSVLDSETGGGSYTLEGTFTLSITNGAFTLTTDLTGTDTDSDEPILVLQRFRGEQTESGGLEITQTEQYDSQTDAWYSITGIDTLTDVTITAGEISVSETDLDLGEFTLNSVYVAGDVSYPETTVYDLFASTFTLDGEEISD